MPETIYIKASANSIIYTPNARLGDVLKIQCNDISVLRQIKQMELYRFNHPHSVVFSILKVIELIQKEYPNAGINNCGEVDFVVEYIASCTHSKVWEKCKLFLICTIVFFGSAFTIMTFHNDVGIQDVFGQFYEQLMGKEKPFITELEISYSIGLAIGIVMFFNHFGKRKISQDPTPIEVEIAKYNQDLNITKIADSEKKGHKEDVN